MKVNDENSMIRIQDPDPDSGSESGSNSQRHGSADPDPDPPQNVMDPQHCLFLDKELPNYTKTTGELQVHVC